MDIAVDRRGIDLKEKNRRGMQPLCQDSVARFTKRKRERGTADHAPVDERHLEGPVAPPLARLGNPTVNPHPALIHGRDGQELFQKCLTVKIAQPDRQILRRSETEHLPIIPDAGEGDLGMGDGKNLDLLEEVRGLGLLAPKEFTTRRDIEKDIGNLDRGAGSITGILHLVDLPAAHLDERARIILAPPRGETESGDACNAGQSLPPESERGDGGKVSAFPDLAGGVPLEAEERIRAIHPGAVVRDTDQPGAAPLELDGDAPSSGIDGVLDQFLDHGGRSLDHLTRSHLAGEDIGENLDAAHSERMNYE